MNLANKVLLWYDQHGRKDLPWQQSLTAYGVWVSEIMLQQTQVATVIPYYERFMQRFSSVEVLAKATEDDVLQYWSGLGYYSRARNLHKAAQVIMQQHQGFFPNTLDEAMQLPGIGRSTAAAVLSLAYGQKQAILDGNVKRVLARYHAIEGWPGEGKVLKQLWQVAESHVPDERNAHYTQAMMDMGATLCTRAKPQCLFCPIKVGCKAYQMNEVSRFPYSKPKKVLPEKSVVMLMLQNTQGEILLQKRPSVGVWGGMWSLPEFSDQVAAKTWFIARYLGDFMPEALPEIKHTFSHYRLIIQPFLHRLEQNDYLEASQAKRVMEDSPQLWYNNDKIFNGGLASPISKLLKRFLA